MSFHGFSEEDFEFFIDRDEDKRRKLKIKMKALREAVKNRLPSSLANKFRFGRVGILRGDAPSCWASFSEYEDFPRYTHISMSFSVDGFDVWLNTETIQAIKRLRNNIERDPVTFYNLLKSLMERRLIKEPYHIQLFERERKENQPLPGKWPWFIVLESVYSDASTLIFLYGKLMELKYPVFKVRVKFDIRTSSENRELLMSEDIIEKIVNVISDLTPLHDFANR